MKPYDAKTYQANIREPTFRRRVHVELALFLSRGEAVRYQSSLLKRTRVQDHEVYFSADHCIAGGGTNSRIIPCLVKYFFTKIKAVTKLITFLTIQGIIFAKTT